MAHGVGGTMRTILIVLALLLAGCASNDAGNGEDAPSESLPTASSTTSSDGTMDPARVEVEVRLTGTYSFLAPANDFEYGPDFEVRAGDLLVLTFNNQDQSGSAHDVCLDLAETPCTEQISGGETSTIEWLVPDMPGDYAFFCSIGNHRQSGMEGTFTILTA